LDNDGSTDSKNYIVPGKWGKNFKFLQCYLMKDWQEKGSLVLYYDSQVGNLLSTINPVKEVNRSGSDIGGLGTLL